MSIVKIVVGLGNPGRDYATTRHNLGFMVIDTIARRLSASEPRTRFRADIIEAVDANQKLVLLKPQTFMNRSGTSVRETVRWYKASLDDVLVIADDIDLPFGTLRMRANGGSGGHNGLKSIFSELGTQDVPRLRIGIGRGPGHATRQVLTRFSKEEERDLPQLVQAAAECVLDWQRHGVTAAMNRCNRKRESEVVTRSAPETALLAIASGAETPSHDSETTMPPSATPLLRRGVAYTRILSWWKKRTFVAED